jgi:Yip1 domain
MTEPLGLEDESPPTFGQRLTAALAVPGRLLGALFLPDRYVPDAVREKRSASALIAVTLCALMGALVIGQRLDPSLGVGMGGPPGPQQMGEQPQSEREIAEQQSRQKSMMRVTMALGAGFGTPALLMIAGLGLFLAGRYVGGKPTVGGMVTATALSALPQAVKSIVTTIAALRYEVLSPMQVMDITSSASLVPKGVQLQPLVAKLAMGIDVFTVWSLLILGFGFAAAATTSKKKAFVTVVVLFAVVQLLSPSPMGGR